MPDVGGFLDNMDGDIVDAEFVVATGKYADKVMTGGSDAKPPVIARLTIESPDLEAPAVQSFSIGSQDIWEISDDGKSVTNIKNPEKHSFRKGSAGWMLVEAMMTAAGEGDLEKGQDFFAKRDTFMTDSRFYEGTSWHWAVKEIKYQIGDKQVISRPPLPEKFLGETRPVTKGKAAATKKSEVPENSELDNLLIEKAAGKTDRELKSFVVREPKFKENDAYVKAVVSGKKLKQLEDSGSLTRDPDTQRYI